MPVALLAQAAPQAAERDPSTVTDVVIASIVLIVVIVGGVLIATAIRNKLKADPDNPGGPGSAFSLHQLRQLHARGEITDQQFTQLKAELISGMSGGTNPIAEARKARSESSESGSDPPPSSQ